MSKRVLVYDEVLDMLLEAQSQRIEDGWKRGISLEQIASEAIIFWCSQGNNYRFRDINHQGFILKNAGKPANETLELEDGGLANGRE